jgi:hypothetical protein
VTAGQEIAVPWPVTGRCRLAGDVVRLVVRNVVAADVMHVVMVRHVVADGRRGGRCEERRDWQEESEHGKQGCARDGHGVMLLKSRRYGKGLRVGARNAP